MGGFSNIIVFLPNQIISFVILMPRVSHQEMTKIQSLRHSREETPLEQEYNFNSIYIYLLKKCRYEKDFPILLTLSAFLLWSIGSIGARAHHGNRPDGQCFGIDQQVC